MSILFTTNPGASFTVTGVLPICFARSITKSCTWGAVSCPLITSTSFITGAGLKKCIPITLSALFVDAAISVIEREEVLDARIVSGLQILSNVPNISLFRSICSRIASITISASENKSYVIVPVTLDFICSLSAAVIFSFSTSFERFFDMIFWPDCNSASEIPFITTVKPA